MLLAKFFLLCFDLIYSMNVAIVCILYAYNLMNPHVYLWLVIIDKKCNIVITSHFVLRTCLSIVCVDRTPIVPPVLLQMC
jgi:hypothetical protein